ncbi:Bul1-C domain-containing protein [Fusarium keratoplasticum]|uniref:Bul1-C domain-containing protein n=1 Tax=Fusarium keratoplasticum TaxID=1328300 RepID=A0ACC0QFH1_9HYPO|nr:Bul1-C domain-containing protein [Fusarium keratoplasticum]KAI8650798.1 Bul1-C domain-containing protein [Fusarium keratoplasticum]
MSPHALAKPRGRSWVPSLVKTDSPIEISVNGHFESKVYTSGSSVTGTVTITPPMNLSFESLEVVFTGSTSTLVQMLQREAPRATHTFLELKMPIPEDSLPESGVLLAGLPYTIPFSFVIPYQLPSASCRNRNPVIRDRHLQPPPTIGSWEHDDLSIHSITIDYAVKAKITLKDKLDKKGKPETIQGRHPVKVMPFFPEQPPLHIHPANPNYQLSQEKLVRKDLLSAKIGHLRVTAVQPDPVVLSADKLQPSEGSVAVELEFWPASSKATPPEVYAKAASLQASTHYSTGHINFLPDQHKHPVGMPNPILTYFIDDAIVLDKQEKLEWEQHPSSGENSRRGSEYSNESQESAGASSSRSRRSSRSDDIIKTASIKHKATLKVPFELPGPDKKVLLPTFFSCLVSRTYTIRIIVTTGPHGSSLALTLPLQIAVEGCNSPQLDGIPHYTQIDGEQDVGDYILPPYEVDL